jgi:hypothetical protein
LPLRLRLLLLILLLPAGPPEEAHEGRHLLRLLLLILSEGVWICLDLAMLVG